MAHHREKSRAFEGVTAIKIEAFSKMIGKTLSEVAAQLTDPAGTLEIEYILANPDSVQAEVLKQSNLRYVFFGGANNKHARVLSWNGHRFLRNSSSLEQKWNLSSRAVFRDNFLSDGAIKKRIAFNLRHARVAKRNTTLTEEERDFHVQAALSTADVLREIQIAFKKKHNPLPATPR